MGTVIAFRTGYSDAEFLENEMARTFTASTISDLERFEAVVNLLAEGANGTPFRAQTLPAVATPGNNKKKLIARSRERFSVPRSLVEEKLNRWIAHNNNATQ